MDKLFLKDAEKIHCAFPTLFASLAHSKILITGACGLITSYLAKILLCCIQEYPFELYLQCRNIRKAEKLFEGCMDTGHVHLVDFPLEKEIPSDVRYDYILHGASPCSTHHFVHSPVDVIAPNALGTWNLLQYARNCGTKKVVFFSSNSIYGEGGISTDILTEKDLGIVDPLGVRSCYIESKRLAEQMCRAFSVQYGVPSSIVRICHTYGPTFSLEGDSRIIARIIRQITQNEDITMYKDPDSVIQYTYVADIATAILFLMLCGESGEAYNACGDEIMTMDQVVECMLKSDPRIRSRLIEKPIDENYAFSKGKGINFIKLSNSKLRSLGWRPLWPNEEGLTQVIQYYLDKCSIEERL